MLIRKLFPSWMPLPQIGYADLLDVTCRPISHPEAIQNPLDPVLIG